jgi:hypothetical protein
MRDESQVSKAGRVTRDHLPASGVDNYVVSVAIYCPPSLRIFRTIVLQSRASSSVSPRACS